MLTKPPVPYDFCVADPISRFQLGEGPSRGLLRDYEPSDGPLFESLVESRRIDIHNVHNGAGGSQQNICLDRADVTGLGDVIVPLHNNNVSCCDLQCQWRHFLTHRTPSACRPPPPPPPACASALCSQLPASWTRPALNTRQGQPLLCSYIT